MGFEQLRQDVWHANIGLVDAGLVVLTWGNASGADREAGVMAIKPSGVDYESLQPEDLVVLSIETGEAVDGDLRPSSDTATHLLLYQGFESIGGVVHTHSTCAAAWAQARMEIPCLGTTHADHFYGPVPLTRELTPEEVAEDYEHNCGKIILERFEAGGIDPDQAPAALLPGHGPFAWGKDAASALKNAIVLEETARLAFHTLALNPQAAALPRFLLDKHFLRKHGANAYYGQENA
ncbi:MAG: L-ribulose-5-phosphate 4-epimerase AraD [Planctomycetota bacterium]|jgi:L-ribulose-5-phosphate 4-epimerase